jgi:hypothetical protein
VIQVAALYRYHHGPCLIYYSAETNSSGAYLASQQDQEGYRTQCRRHHNSCCNDCSKHGEGAYAHIMADCQHWINKLLDDV